MPTDLPHGGGAPPRPPGRKGGGSTDDRRVADVMCARTATVRPDDSLARAVELMETLGTRELVVTEGGRVIGILTRTDLEPLVGHYEWTLVRTAMTPDPETVAPDAPIAAAARLLLERRFNCLPVLAGGALVGMLRRSDLLQALASAR